MNLILNKVESFDINPQRVKQGAANNGTEISYYYKLELYNTNHVSLDELDELSNRIKEFVTKEKGGKL